MIYVPTWEEERALKTFYRLAKDAEYIKTPRAVFIWRITSGIEQIESEIDVAAGGKVQQDTTDPLKALDFIQKYDAPAMLVLLDFHIYFDSRKPEPKVIRKIRDTVNMLKGGAVPKNVILLSPRLMLPNELQKDITTLDNGTREGVFGLLQR